MKEKTQDERNIAAFLGRQAKILSRNIFKEKDAFCSLYAAQDWVKSQGYSCGSICGDMPIALQKGEYILPQKWGNMSSKDMKSIDGIIKSDDFRNGAVTVLIFKHKDC